MAQTIHQACAGSMGGLTSQMSDIKAQIAFHQAWLQVQGPQVAEAYDA